MSDLIRFGSKGSKVQQLHDQLVDLGHLAGNLPEPDHYREIMTCAVRRVQVLCGLKNDGIVGPKTRRGLRALMIETRDPLMEPLDALPESAERLGPNRASLLQHAIDDMLARKGEGPRNNVGPDIDHYFDVTMRHDPDEPQGGPWCGACVGTWGIEGPGLRELLYKPFVWVTAGIHRAKIAQKFVYTPQGAELYEAYFGEPPMGQVSPISMARPGDLFFQSAFHIDKPREKWGDWNGTIIGKHVGMFHHFGHGTEYFYTVEGNVGSYPAVVAPRQLRVDRRDLLGYARFVREK